MNVVVFTVIVSVPNLLRHASPINIFANGITFARWRFRTNTNEVIMPLLMKNKNL